ncbi:hypothetical protein AAFF_G00400190 [Aldrovandia affinis]|uniref:Uncharacterized protein n=1 Tax=Aldrovandia affinis TaxID=143900 RepID=A0AAD7R3N8_9TELE|nr:hypothetical protein AAFF_G00400190 [Aldrovandia affinis]
MPYMRRYPSSEWASRGNYQDQAHVRKYRRRTSPSLSSSIERERRGGGHRHEGSYLRSRRPYDWRYCKGYRRLDYSREKERERDWERDRGGAPDGYYTHTDFTLRPYNYRRDRERERDRKSDESYGRKDSRQRLGNIFRYTKFP